ncbi:FAD-binding oxidoreductase [Acidocella sp.]|uniref:FAD-binding oxidoreductase n=1 Tax=Acidocella sp. TaxID=50710 RepID=UPI003CFCED96
MNLIEALRAALGEGAVLTNPSERAAYEQDWRGLVNNPALAVILPKSTEQVSQAVRLCAAHSVRIVPQGGNTGLVAGAVPIEGADQVILSFSRLRAVREIDVLADTITVEAGMTLAAVQQEAANANRFFPVSLGAEGTAEIGGVISTNAGGLQVLSYGNMRAQVLGLEVVLADGTLWHGLSGLRKDNTGYDLKQVFIGSEGTLGLITAATLRLHPPVASRASALVGIENLEQGLRIFSVMRHAAGPALTLCEFCTHAALALGAAHTQGGRLPFAAPAYLLLEISALEGGRDPQEMLETVLMKELEEGRALDAAIAQSERERLDFLALRENISEGELREGGAVKHDISVSLSRLAELVSAVETLVARDYPGFRPNIFGHVGDGNLHVNIRPPEGQDMAAIAARKAAITTSIETLAVSLQGSFSAEHGIGQLRLPGMVAHKSPTDLSLMRAIKHALDPAGLLNPGKTVPEV